MNPARRRRAGFLILGSSLRPVSPVVAPRAALLIVVTLPPLLGCGGPPRQILEGAAQAMRHSSEVDGVTRAPEICSAAQAALARAEAEVRVQDRRSFLSRDYSEAEDLAALALRSAQSCDLHARIVRNQARSRAEIALTDLEGSIGRVRALARHIPDDEGIRSDLTAVEVTLGEGRGGFEHGQFERAAEAAGRGREQVAHVVAEINRFVDRFQASPRRAIWRRWVLETLRDSARARTPVILVDKLRRQLLLMQGPEEITSYMVDLGTGGIDSKTRAGDEATPEGRYRVTQVRDVGQTRYYRALMLDYPNEEDRLRFRNLRRSGKVPRGQGIGGDIEIHGQGGRGQDWTQGCVALDNDDMDDLVPRVAVGTQVTIVGTIPDGTIP
ncbi:MAG TPA: L,D-transpeptidase family protein [Candidatus Polarisedimenticolia bacterium]|nr:L,D-transpeptidase family protein [Candidatus Polarisedimenticolia bacterium]